MTTTTPTAQPKTAPPPRGTFARLWTPDPRMKYITAGLLAGPVMLFLGWPSTHPAVLTALILLTAYSLFCWTSCFHETVHHTLRGSKFKNIWLGRVIGTILLIPYTCYREVHIRHHAYLNTPNDWELWPYTDPNRSRGFRRVFAWLDLLLGNVTHTIIYGRIYWSRQSPLSDESRRAARNEYIGIVLFWSAVVGAVAWSGLWWPFVRAWIIPAVVAGWIQSGRKFTEHLGMSSYDPLLGTRTVIGHNWVTRLGSFFNFNIFIHGLHHRHPRLPHENLEPKMEEYLQTNPELPYPLFHTYWRATRDMLPHFFKNPGCGINAGAAPPPRAKLPDVQDFVADVATEILPDPAVATLPRKG